MVDGDGRESDEGKVGGELGEIELSTEASDDHEMTNIRKFHGILALVLGLGALGQSLELLAQAAKPAENAGTKPEEQAPAQEADTQGGQAYSGMYTFLKEGEFVQLTVEDDGRITGFISRFAEGENDKGAFLDQFFKSGKLDGNKLSFTTAIVHGVSFAFKGTVERGEGKNPADEAYFVLKGTLNENTTDANKKVTSRAQDVMFKLFPQEAGAK